MKKVSITKQLNDQKAETEFYRGKNVTLNEMIDDLRKKDENNVRNMCSELSRSNDNQRQLLEVIRWMINPETAKFPFRSDKDQRDERDCNAGRY